MPVAVASSVTAVGMAFQAAVVADMLAVAVADMTFLSGVVVIFDILDYRFFVLLHTD